MASWRNCSPSRSSPLRIFSLRRSSTAAARDWRGMGVDFLGARVFVISASGFIVSIEQEAHFRAPKFPEKARELSCRAKAWRFTALAGLGPGNNLLSLGNYILNGT